MISKINEESKDDITNIFPQDTINRSSKSFLDKYTKNTNRNSVDKTSDHSSIRFPFRSNTLFLNQFQSAQPKESISTTPSVILRSKVSNETKKRAKRASLKLATGNTPLLLLNSIKDTNENTPYSKTLRHEKLTMILLGGLSILSILLSLIDNELYIHKVKVYYEQKYKEGTFTKLTYELYKELQTLTVNSKENVIRFLNGIVSCCEVVIVYYKYKFILRKNIYEYKLSEYDTIQTSGHLKRFILESIAAFIFFPPFVHYNFAFQKGTLIYILPLNNLCSILSLIKLYFVLQSLPLFTRYNSNIAKTICKTHTVSHGLQFVIRCQMRDHPFFAMSIITVVFFCIISSMLRVVEFSSYDIELGLIGKKGLNDLGNHLNCFWYMIVIASTVGYGDEYPRNILGRLLSLLGWFFGIVGLGLTISSLTSVSEFSEADRKAFMKLQKLYDPENEQHKAVNVVKTVLFLKKLTKEKKENKNISGIVKLENFKEKCFFIMKLYVETKLFKDKYKVARNYSMPISDLMRTFEGKLYDNVVSFTKHLEKINFVENDFIALQKTQKLIQSKLKLINNAQKEICLYLINQHNKSILEKRKKELTKKKHTQLSLNSSHKNHQSELGLVLNAFKHKKTFKGKHTGIYSNQKGKFLSLIMNQQNNPTSNSNSNQRCKTKKQTLSPERRMHCNLTSEIKEHINEN